MRRLVAIALAGLAFFVLWTLVVRPWQCNVAKRRVMNRVALFERSRSATPYVRRLAERSFDELSVCDSWYAVDVSAEMLRAGIYRTIGRNDRALEIYDRLLTRSRRPEIYVSRAEMLAAAGRTEEAIADFTAAARFSRTWLTEIRDSSLRREVSYRVFNAIDPSADLLTNGSLRATRGTKAESTGGSVESPLIGWRIWSAGGVTRAEVTPEGLSVRSEHPHGGLVQVWDLAGAGPENVVTTATILVRSGSVGIGSGNAEQTRVDRTLSASPEWQTVSAVNQSCPANQTIIYALAPNTDFVIARATVTVRPAPRRNCE